MHADDWVFGLNQGSVIQIVADLFHHWFERDEVQYHAGLIQFPFQRDGNLVVVAVQRFSAAIGEDQEMSRREVKVIFSDFDAKAA